MRVLHVVSAVNNNPQYTRFVPLFVQRWKRLYPDITITIVYVDPSPTLPPELQPYAQYIQHYSPPLNMSTAFVAQTIRFLWPALISPVTPDDGVLITDIDMIPGNNLYFDVPLRPYSLSTFVSMRPQRVTESPNQIAMCYGVATPACWRDIFEINDVTDIDRFLTHHYPSQSGYDSLHGGKGWFSDQELLYAYVMMWNQRTGNPVVFLEDEPSGYRRLDLAECLYDSDLMIDYLKTGRYSDCHLYAHNCPWILTDIQHYILPLI